MKRFAELVYQRILDLVAGLLFAAVVLRTALNYGDSPILNQALPLLFAWLLLFISEDALSRKAPWYFPFYVALQTALAIGLLTIAGPLDFSGVLFCILSMQIMQRLEPRLGAFCIGLFTVVMAVPMIQTFGVSRGIADALIYTAGNALLGSYSFATRRAQSARIKNQALAQELENANRQLQTYATQHQELAIARERHRLARDLHDSVTQTIFSMTLTTQSALLLLDCDPGRVSPQLERLSQLAAGALSEMQVLISQLRPEKNNKPGLVLTLRRHLAERELNDQVQVSLDVHGDQPLSPLEEQNLYGIAQEALNNIVKHAHVAHACIRVQLCEPFSIEILDDGQGFDLAQARDKSRVGLGSMRERAAEIGWDFRIVSVPGTGTRVRVEKRAPQSEET